MNIYVVTEGKIEGEVYKQWIPYVNQNLSLIEHLTDINFNNFYIVSAHGYPDYFDVIDSAINDVNDLLTFDRLVISVDSGEMTKEEKIIEISEFISGKKCVTDIKIVIQHFCFETWALGNRKIIRPNPRTESLRRYIRFFNVRRNDPELLPSMPGESLNREKFAEKYLRKALNDLYRNLTYTKSNPRPLLHRSYFTQVKGRLDETGHISSFDNFLTAFI